MSSTFLAAPETPGKSSSSTHLPPPTSLGQSYDGRIKDDGHDSDSSEEERKKIEKLGERVRSFRILNRTYAARELKDEYKFLASSRPLSVVEPASNHDESKSDPPLVTNKSLEQQSIYMSISNETFISTALKLLERRSQPPPLSPRAESQPLVFNPKTQQWIDTSTAEEKEILQLFDDLAESKNISASVSASSPRRVESQQLHSSAGTSTKSREDVIKLQSDVRRARSKLKLERKKVQKLEELYQAQKSELEFLKQFNHKLLTLMRDETVESERHQRERLRIETEKNKILFSVAAPGGLTWNSNSGHALQESSESQQSA